MLHVTGINHKKTPVSIREKIVFSKAELRAFLNLVCNKGIIQNIVLLSTCNRTEVYYTVNKACAGIKTKYVIDMLVQFKQLEDTIEHFFYSYSESGAVEHLFRVSSGLDSLILGENQILGQVKEAYRMSVELGCTNTILNKLFHKAFEIGKMVRNKTGINKGASSVGYAAVELALKIFNSLKEHSVLLIGIGETGMLVLKSLVERGSSVIYIANRTYEKALQAVKDYDAQPIPFDQFLDYMIKSDIIITSTASSSCLVTKKDVQHILMKRKNRYLFIIDLSVPRNVEEDIGKLNNVFLYNIDSLHDVVSNNYKKRKREIKKAEIMIQQAIGDIQEWIATLNLSPTIKLLKERVESIGKKELKVLKKQVPDKEYERLEDLTECIKKKFFNLIIKNLKEHSHNGQQLELINLVNKLFEL